MKASIGLNRTLFQLICLFAIGSALAQQPRIDSIHVYEQVIEGPITSAKANALIWRLHQQDAEHTTLKGEELVTVRETMQTYKPLRHTYGTFEELQHMAMVFSGGRPLAFAVTDDLDLLINFTARTEYRISSLSDHLYVRALLAKMLMER